MATALRPPGILDRTAWAPWVLLGLGVLAASVSAILIRYAHEAHPLAISFWRSAAGAMVLLPFARKGLRGMPSNSFGMPLAAGLFLALHFGTWVWSVQLTTVAVSVLLLSTTPIFVALAAWLWLKERLGVIGWTGILVTVAGAAAISGGDLSGSNFVGNILALIGGATAGGYTLAGQVARRNVGIFEYAVLAYASSAVLLLGACLVAGAPLWGYRAETWLWIGAIIVGPQLLGHTVINLVLKQIDATVVSVMIMLEPLVATWLAYVLFDELPSLLVYPAGAAILIGIYLVSSARRQVPTILEAGEPSPDSQSHKT